VLANRSELEERMKQIRKVIGSSLFNELKKLAQRSLLPAPQLEVAGLSV
jgi:hypothetical protein